MIEDLFDHPHDATIETDMAVVGAGAAGITGSMASGIVEGRAGLAQFTQDMIADRRLITIAKKSSLRDRL